MHPALQLPFDSLLENLEEERRAGFLSRKEHGALVLYNYNRFCTFKRHWTPFTRIARGLVLVPKEKRIVALPFPKFFNYSELGRPVFPIDSETSVTEKMDGSLGIIFFFQRWHVVTRGSFDSVQSQWAHKWLTQHQIFDRLDKGVTYLTEIIYPENRVVVPYDFEKIILLGAYRSDGVEVIDLESLRTGLEITQSHTFNSLSEIEQACLTLPFTREGFVLRKPDGTRIKFKGTAYCQAQKAQIGLTPLVVWKMMRDQEDLDAFRAGLPEEFYEEFDNQVQVLREAFEKACEQIDLLSEKYSSMTNKEVAQSTLCEDEKALIFMRRRPRYQEELENGKTRKTVFDSFKPK